MNSWIPLELIILAHESCDINAQLLLPAQLKALLVAACASHITINLTRASLIVGGEESELLRVVASGAAALVFAVVAAAAFLFGLGVALLFAATVLASASLGAKGRFLLFCWRWR